MENKDRGNLRLTGNGAAAGGVYNSVKMTGENAIEQMLKLDEEIRGIISDSALPKGTLRIGAPESLCICYLPSLLKGYHRLYPEVEIILKLGGAAELCSWLCDPPAHKLSQRTVPRLI